MPAPLSVDLRQGVIAAYQAKEGSQLQLAKRFKPTFRTLNHMDRAGTEALTPAPAQRPYE